MKRRYSVAAAVVPTSSPATASDAYAYCERATPGAIARRWTRERVGEAMLDLRRRYGPLTSSYDWSRTPRAGAGERRSGAR